MERANPTVQVKSGIVMWHVVLRCDDRAQPAGVSITQNPLQFAGCMAQVVMWKTRSLQVAQQVARFVRRHYGLTSQVQVHRMNRPVEAMIGYVCMGGYQHRPTAGVTPGFDLVVYMSGRKVSELCEEAKGGPNAARGRWWAYELRTTSHAPMRGVTNKFHSVEREWRDYPADTVTDPEVLVKGTFATRAEAVAACEGFEYLDDKRKERLWTKRPPAEYMRRILRLQDGDIVFASTGDSAIRPYGTPTCVVGPHSYTVPHVRHVLMTGLWYGGYIRGPSGPQEML